MDLFESGCYDARVFRTTRLWEGLQEDYIIQRGSLPDTARIRPGLRGRGFFVAGSVIESSVVFREHQTETEVYPINWTARAGLKESPAALRGYDLSAKIH